jgi:hypothetical protein
MTLLQVGTLFAHMMVGRQWCLPTTLKKNDMGQFSWFTQDTNHRIVNNEPFKVVMCDNKGNKYVEHCYEGYGEFGGKDYYELLAEMNGITLADVGGDKNKLRTKGIQLAFDGHTAGDNPNVLHPSLTESGKYMGGIAPEIDPNQGFHSYYTDGL